MPQPASSPAYKQIIHWYQQCEAVQTARPIQMLVTSGAPDEAIDGPKQASPATRPLDVIA
jgi:hypothetical protein